MRINVESVALMALMAELASDAKNEARIKFPGTQGDAAIMGVALLHENIRITLQDAEAFDLSPETEAQAVRSATNKFCAELCHFSREVPPGEHETCQRCPLMPFTVEAIEGALERAVKNQG